MNFALTRALVAHGHCHEALQKPCVDSARDSVSRLMTSAAQFGSHESLKITKEQSFILHEKKNALSFAIEDESTSSVIEDNDAHLSCEHKSVTEFCEVNLGHTFDDRGGSSSSRSYGEREQQSADKTVNVEVATCADIHAAIKRQEDAFFYNNHASIHDNKKRRLEDRRCGTRQMNHHTTAKRRRLQSTSGVDLVPDEAISTRLTLHYDALHMACKIRQQTNVCDVQRLCQAALERESASLRVKLGVCSVPWCGNAVQRSGAYSTGMHCAAHDLRAARGSFKLIRHERQEIRRVRECRTISNVSSAFDEAVRDANDAVALATLKLKN